MHILIVEDERRLANLIRRALEEESHVADISHDGADALELVHATEYDLIVLDGPSVPACAESELFCGVIDGVIIMVRWGRTTKGDLFSAMRILRVYGVRTLGAVLNAVDIKQLTRSGANGLYRYYAEH